MDAQIIVFKMFLLWSYALLLLILVNTVVAYTAFFSQ